MWKDMRNSIWLGLREHFLGGGQSVRDAAWRDGVRKDLYHGKCDPKAEQVDAVDRSQ